MRILLVEDDLLVRETLAMDLRDQGYDVIEAETGDEARGVDAFAFDVLVTDIRMPGQITGWQLAELYRDARPDLPVLYMTGYSDEPHRQVAGSRLLAKPFRLGELKAHLSELPGAGVRAPARGGAGEGRAQGGEASPS
jgi:DNA-binding response OmpR family regulator